MHGFEEELAKLRLENKSLKQKLTDHEQLSRERALEESEHRLRDYLEASSDWVWEMDSHCRFSYFSDRFEEISGVAPEALLGKTREETGIPDLDSDIWAEHLAILAAHRSFRDFRHPRVLSDGTTVTLSISGKAVFGPDNEFLGYRGIGRDITNQLEAERKARRAELLLAGAIESLSELFVLWDSDDRLVMCNEVFREINQAIVAFTEPGTRMRDHLIAGLLHDLYPDAEGREEAWLVERLRRHHDPGEPFEVQRQDGRWLLMHGQKLPDGGMVTIGTDITERKRNEAALQAAHDELERRVEERTADLVGANRDLQQEIADREIAQRELRENQTLLHAMVDNLPDLAGLRDPDGRYLLVNKRFEDWNAKSREEVIGKYASEFWPEELARDFSERDAQVIASRAPISREQDIAFGDGELRTVRSVRFPVFIDDDTLLGVGFINTDITEGKRLEARLRQSQRMEAVGQLTGGVAHDFNNLLGVVLGNLDFLDEELRDNEELRKLTQSAIRAVEKGAKLNRQLLAYSRRQPLAPKAIDLNEQMVDMVDLMRRTLGESIEIGVVSAAGLWPCMADPAQVEAALLNLVINARDAMPKGGRLTIETSNRELDAAYAADYDDVKPGAYAALTVRDEGTGMPADVLARVFEPFFTTKDVGQGSGLGLSMVFGFAKQSGGHVAIASEEGVGTTVTLYLPRAESA